MDDHAIVLNAGSSSLKFSIYRRPEAAAWTVDLRGQIDGIGTSPRFTAKDGSDARVADDRLAQGLDGRGAFDALASWLRARYGGDARVLGVGHRVVHGGAKYAGPRLSRRKSSRTCARSCRWRPFINRTTSPPSTPCPSECRTCRRSPASIPAFIAGSRRSPRWCRCRATCAAAACSDTDSTGSRTEYIASVLPDVAPEIAHGRVIVAHLGSGASLCAMKNLKSVDSTLGFTALDGLCMGTRPGSIDPGVILHLVQTLGLSAKDLETVLYKKSGLLGISGISNDMRNLLDSSEPGARLAVDYFVYQAAKQIGALAAALGGVDGLVFTAGIGENSAEIRKRICHASAWLGIDFDEEANTARGPRISRAGSRVSAWVVPTNEELIIARHTGQLLGL